MGDSTESRIGFVNTAAINGVQALPVTVEVNVAFGLPGISIVGMPDTAVNEAKLRVRQALRACGYEVPNMHIIVNLAPSSMPKSGSGFDLPIALGILLATSQIPKESVGDRLCVGELSLDGSVRPVKGMLAYEQLASKNNNGLISAVVERGVEQHDSVINPNLIPNPDPDPDIDPNPDPRQNQHLCIETLADLRECCFQDPLSSRSRPVKMDIDYCEIAGNELSKRALQIAAAGNHSLLMIGPPGSGKSMMAARLPTILPPLGKSERIQSAMIHSVAGLPYDTILEGYQPFRAPHHSATRAGLLGGGSPPAPGEVSLAHNGVLFLDEMPEFGSAVLQLLRQPMETGEVSLARARGTTVFPAKFMLIGASNPCPCGYYGDPEQDCKCSEPEIARYQSKIGGPLMDRFDMVVDVWRSKPSEVLATGTGLSSRAMLSGVQAALEFRTWREEQDANLPTSKLLSSLRPQTNSRDTESLGKLTANQKQSESSRSQDHLLDTDTDTDTDTDPGTGSRLLESCKLGQRERSYLEKAAKHFCLSGRGIMRALGIARTIADLAQKPKVTSDHLLEAVTFRAEGRSGHD